MENNNYFLSMVAQLSTNLIEIENNNYSEYLSIVAQSWHNCETFREKMENNNYNEFLRNVDTIVKHFERNRK